MTRARTLIFAAATVATMTTAAAPCWAQGRYVDLGYVRPTERPATQVAPAPPRLGTTQGQAQGQFTEAERRYLRAVREQQERQRRGLR